MFLNVEVQQVKENRSSRNKCKSNEQNGKKNYYFEMKRRVDICNAIANNFFCTFIDCVLDIWSNIPWCEVNAIAIPTWMLFETKKNERNSIIQYVFIPNVLSGCVLMFIRIQKSTDRCINRENVYTQGENNLSKTYV